MIDRLMLKKRDQGGFTLVEVLLVIFILGILAGVVTVSVTGMVGRGEKEAYATDEKTIQTAVSAFYADLHAYSKAGGWNETGNITSSHNFPTGSASYYYDDGTKFSLHAGSSATVNGYRVFVVMRQDRDGSPPTEATTLDVAAAAIWMGLLTNWPGEGKPGKDKAPPGDKGDYLVAPLRGENGPYLNPLPKSCSPYNAAYSTGSITWIVAEYGRVYGVFEDGGIWYAGFGGKYP